MKASPGAKILITLVLCMGVRAAVAALPQRAGAAQPVKVSR